MAALIVSKSNQQDTLKRLVKKEKSGKVVRKNVLCTEIQEWPRPSDEVQDDILTKLSEKLLSLPNIFKKAVKQPKDVEIKAKVRSQLAIGVSQVFRDLEKDRLDCVLVSGQATPAITVSHVITLCQERGCPILCLDQLAVSVAKSTDTSCFPLAIGFKKMSESDFTEVVSLVKANAPASSSVSGSTGSEKTVVMSLNQPVSSNLIKLSTQEEDTILAELKREFTQILVVPTVNQNVKKKPKKKPKKKVNLKTAFDKNSHQLFDFGKRTVSEMVERDKVQLVLVSEEIAPVLLGEPQSSSLLRSCLEKHCPIVMVTGLTSTLRAMCQGCVSVVGIKKYSSSSSGGKQFISLVDVCFHAISRLNPGTQPTVNTAVERSMGNLTKGDNEEAASTDEVEGDYSDLYVLKKDSQEYSEAMSKLKEEMEKVTRDQKFGSDFISLDGASQTSAADKTGKSGLTTSAKPKVGPKPMKIQRIFAADQALEPSNTVKSAASCGESMVEDEGSGNVTSDSGPKPGNSLIKIQDTSADIQSFTLSRAGDANLVHKHKLTPEPTPAILTQTRAKDCEELVPSQLSATSKVPAGLDYIALSQSIAKKSKKKHLKRKLETDGFLAFGYKEANIKTMTSNPNKKKKK